MGFGRLDCVVMSRADTWRQGFAAGEAGGAAEGFFDAQELVVFGDAVGAGGGAGFDLAGAHGDYEIGEEGVFGFAAAMGDDGGVVGLASHFDGFDGFGDGADLIELDQDGVADAFGDAAGENFRVGDENIVADELDFFAEVAGEEFPAVPIVFGEAVFDGDDGIPAAQDSQKLTICAEEREDLSDFLKT